MARKLKTYQTSLGFFDEAIAAPSMKAALEAWGTKTNLFHQGVAKEVDDPDIIAATMRKLGSHSEAPYWLKWAIQRTCRSAHISARWQGQPRKRPAKLKQQPPRQIDHNAPRKAA